MEHSMALSSGRHLAFPFSIGANGRTATPANDAAQVRDEVLQLLLTSPGERLFQPDIGGGVRELVFEPASETLRSVVKARVAHSFAQWREHWLTVELHEVAWGSAPAMMQGYVTNLLDGSSD